MRKDENDCQICTCLVGSANEVLKPGDEYAQNQAIAQVDIVVGPKPGTDESEAESALQADGPIPIMDAMGNIGAVDVVQPGEVAPGYKVAPRPADSNPLEQQVAPAYGIASEPTGETAVAGQGTGDEAEPRYDH
jgi:hypothetical protein